MNNFHFKKFKIIFQFLLEIQFILTFPRETLAFRQACIATAVGSTRAASSIDIESGILKQKSDGWQ